MSALDWTRADVLRTFGATGTEVAELLAYMENSFAVTEVAIPLADEPFVEAWAQYAHAAARSGAWDVLREHLVQLRFPIAEGTSLSDAYHRATRRGERAWLPDAPGVVLERPDLVRVFLHDTPAGRIPVIAAGTRTDFVTLLRAVTKQNEPVPIPDSLGASMIAGYNDWGRVARLRSAWEAEASGRTGDDAGWAAAFARLVPHKELYQDRFILLSAGPYSGLPSAALGLDEAEWLGLSFTIRLEHECTHYFTRRVFGSMRNSLMDELMADYAGIVAATGRYRADWFLHFLGLEAFPAYREGGRMQNYRGRPALSDGAFFVLQRIVCSAAVHVEEFDRGLPARRDALLRAQVLTALARLTLDQVASPRGVRLLRDELAEYEGAVQASGTAH